MMRQAMRGGLVNKLPQTAEEIFSTKSYWDFPEETFDLIKMLSFKTDKDVRILQSFQYIFGSSRLKLQPYYGDFDTINLVELDGTKEQMGRLIEKTMKDVVRNIINRGFFMTDVKAGRYSTGKGIHWTDKEVLNGFRDGRNPDINGNEGESYTLYDAIMQDPTLYPDGEPAMLKVDMIAPFNGRYMEITVIYLIIGKKGSVFFFPDNYLESDRIVSSLISDTEKQKKKGRPFKIMKRLFSICRIGYNMYDNNTGFKYAKMIAPIIGTNISRFNSVYSDLSNLKVLLETNKKIDIKFTFQSIQLLKDRYTPILDLENVVKNTDKLDEYINSICKSLLKREPYEKTIEKIETMQELINNIIQKEINLYFKSINTTYDKYVSSVLKWAETLKQKKIVSPFFNLQRLKDNSISIDKINV